MLNLINTVRQSWLRESRMDCLILPQSLEISSSSSQKVMPKHIREWLMSSQPDFPASPSQSPESKPEKTTPAICGPKLGIPYALFDQDTSSWKTCQDSFLTNTSGRSSMTLPKEGMTQDGRLYLLKMWEPPILENDGGVWPTPRAQDGPHGPARDSLGDKVRWPTPRAGNPGSRPNKKGGKILAEEAKKQDGGAKTQPKGQLNPDWVEWLMNWPIGWTSLEPMKEIIWLDWSVDPADKGTQKIWPTPRAGDFAGQSKNVTIKRIKEGGDIMLSSLIKHTKNYQSGSIPRVAVGVKDRVSRLKAIGNGQVSQVVATAWKILTKGIIEEQRIKKKRIRKNLKGDS